MHSRLAPLRVFLADDSEPILQRVAALLRERAMNVVGQAKTPADSINGILKSEPDVVVLDVQLEGGTGLQVLRSVRQVDPHIAFVVFSNNSAAQYRKRYLQEGAVSFLDKGSEFDRLVPAIEEAASSGAH